MLRQSRNPFHCGESATARMIAESLSGGFMPLVVGNVVFIPRRNTSVDEIEEATGIDGELIAEHPTNGEYWIIECPE